MMPPRNFDPEKVTAVRVGQEAGYWTVFGNQKRGTLSTYRVTDANAGEVWRLQVRETSTGQISVHVLDKPAKRKYATISEIAPSIVFEPVSRNSRDCYHPIGLWTPDGTRRIRRGFKSDLPRWFLHPLLRRALRVYSNVKSGGHTLSDKQVVVARRDDHLFQIRSYFAEKVWPMANADTR